MRTQFKIVLLVFTIGISNLTFAQKTQKLSNNEVRKIIELALNLPELQPYFHSDINPERLPIKIKAFGQINATNLKGIKKFGLDVAVLTNEEIEQNNIADYINVGDWTYVGNQLRLQLDYSIEGITANFMFERIDSKWKIKTTALWEE